ncbi:hypothetical protein Pmani_010580 [Petrolisthes manimaculis]|uniref:Calponin-homology (CH) domain-containing protein n=1 Tax=Petrolisthes manimaculis TaxID=1843537 RepID=A0AAE1UFD9_9EUCA|nr:hypothetical protein Pmani_010580 [Petrolisthes manimaculis]
MAFCALIHHFYPDAFDFDELDPKNRRHNFSLAFRVADERGGVMPLLDVEDMVVMKKPDWKCVFTTSRVCTNATRTSEEATTVHPLHHHHNTSFSTRTLCFFSTNTLQYITNN